MSLIDIFKSKNGGVAQLGERQAGSLKVTGSIPVASTIPPSIDLAAGKDKSVIKLFEYQSVLRDKLLAVAESEMLVAEDRKIFDSLNDSLLDSQRYLVNQATPLIDKNWLEDQFNQMNRGDQFKKEYLNTPMIEPLRAPMNYGEIGRKLIGVVPLSGTPMVYMNKELSKEKIASGYNKLFDTEEMKLGLKGEEVLGNGYFYAPMIPIQSNPTINVADLRGTLKVEWTPEIEQDLKMMHGIGVVWPFYILGSRKLDLDDEVEFTREQFEFFQEMKERLEVFRRSDVRALEI